MASDVSYEVVHNMVDTYSQGEVIPPGTYTEAQVERLLGLGAIKPFDPAEHEADPAEAAAAAAAAAAAEPSPALAAETHVTAAADDEQPQRGRRGG